LKVAAVLLLSACAAHVERGTCDPPTFTDAACYDPGGGVTRCPEPDGTAWDRQPTGKMLHWAWCPVAPTNPVVLCEVDP